MMKVIISGNVNSMVFELARKAALKFNLKIQVVSEPEFLTSIKNAIFIATGLTFDEYIKQGRIRGAYFVRLIFTNKCLENGMSVCEISSMIGREKSNVQKYVVKYNNELKVNRNFRALSERVTKLIENNNISL